MHVRQVGVDKIRLRGKLRVTLPLFDELPCVAGIQASALSLPISHVMFQRVVSPPIVADCLVWQSLLPALVPVVFGNLEGYLPVTCCAGRVCGDAEVSF